MAEGREDLGAEPLLATPPAGIDRAWSLAPHEGVAGDLVEALRSRQLLSVAALMAERIERSAPRHMLSGTIVPVPLARFKADGGGFDPAAELAAALAERIGAPVEQCLERSPVGPAGDGRTSGNGSERLIRATAAAPRNALLIDVVEAGAILTDCARALRNVGASRVAAVTFARY
ncbi:MAG: hypothetical protein ACTHLH_08335 [Solirubrobacterales bacterium]